jgi:hypothetical protein
MSEPALNGTQLSDELQHKVQQAIDKGVHYLRRSQAKEGHWSGDYVVARTALAALTLLENGVSPEDEAIQRAAGWLRQRLPKDAQCNHTYTVSLVVLFLDRLNAPQDKDLLRGLALQLIAGQQADGGWGYVLPALQPEEKEKLFHALTQVRPPELQRIIQKLEETRKLERIIAVPSGRQVGGSLLQEAPPQSARFAPPSSASLSATLAALPEKFRRLPGLDIPSPPEAAPERPRPGDKKRPGLGREKLEKHKEKFAGSKTDNSNSQFALLALWAALRHGVPAEHALRRVAERYRDSQAKSGHWGYHIWEEKRTPAMTGVGLLGLAIGHGLSGKIDPVALEDPDVVRGLKAFGSVAYRGDAHNLYFLWTLERVGMLYGQTHIGERDWYEHAVDFLLPKQADSGAWDINGYPGASRHLDTCFSLLVLKRVNLAPELTRTLKGQLLESGPGPDAAPPLR